jgi:uncharacterized membrane protein
MHFTATQVQVLFWIGVVCLILGVCLMAWAVAEARRTAAAGAALDVWTKFLDALGKLVDAIARLFPTVAGRAGFVLALIGLILIFAPAYATVT